MKKFMTICLSLTMLLLLSGWSVLETTEAEGTQTNVIKCQNGKIKAIYLNEETRRYEITTKLSYTTLEEAAKSICDE